MNNQTERLISIQLKEKSESLLYTRQAQEQAYIQPFVGCVPACDWRKPGFLWRCQQLFNRERQVQSWEVWTKHSGASLLLGSNGCEREFSGTESRRGAWSALPWERGDLERAARQEALQSPVSTVKERVPLVKMHFNFLCKTVNHLYKTCFLKSNTTL